MALKEVDRKRLAMRAKRLQRYNEMLLELCENWKDFPDYRARKEKKGGCWRSIRNKCLKNFFKI
ncbi:hypothetical protein [Tannerella forsythia]|uniref:hypothetical protein n=1 Tax=Tannerella forsythia TaxID=28112 RepID=UPI000F5C87B4|nr:hypothetical protein [Tannerella forsythia]